MSTLHELTSAAARTLKAAGIHPEEADLDAQLLAARVLGWDRTRLIAHWRDEAPLHFSPAFDLLVGRRERREPISQILGVREFWGLDFEVTPDVLTPRPETEGLIEAVKAHARDPHVIKDIGTGSGCVAVALAREYPRARLVATDISERALAVARRNAARHGVLDRIAFIHAPADAAGDVDLIVSNPPYIPLPARASLPPEVRDYEPPEALFGGVTGLDVIQSLIDDARNLRAGGFLIFECGADQASAIRDMMAPTREPGEIELVEIRPDLAGIPRVVVARRKHLP